MGVIVHVRLERESKDWPPFSAEEVEADLVSDDRYRIATTPMFAFGMAVGDTVRVRHEAGVLWVDEVTEYGGHSSIRVVVYRGTDPSELIRLAERHEVVAVAAALDGFYTIDVSAKRDLGAIFDDLDVGRRRGWWDVSVGVVATEHQRQLAP